MLIRLVRDIILSSPRLPLVRACYLAREAFWRNAKPAELLARKSYGFYFAVIGEELGFIGGAIILLLYLILFYRGVKIAASAKDSFGTLLATGIVSMLTFHVLVNVGMTAGIMPVTGIPLPLMSYGVSALTTNLVSIGILLNIYMRRQKIMF